MQGWFGLRLNRKSQTAHKQETEKPDEDIADRFGDRGYKGTEKKDSLGACGVESAATAYSERTARETAKNQKPDLIVCCTEIAEDGGEALLTELRSTVPNAGIILLEVAFQRKFFAGFYMLKQFDY